jgi:hypothetical protein
VTDLKPFQEATVDAVCRAFAGSRPTRRFLVADEVGLGKTVVAQHVIQRMMQGRGKPLTVFYLCSNLAIASQNRRKLLEVLNPDERDAADCPVDRLSLLAGAERPPSRKLHLYSLTPDTSIPIRKHQRRDGRAEERALVHALVDQIWPELFEIWDRTVFKRQVTKNWRWHVNEQKKRVTPALREAFRDSVRVEFKIEERRHFLTQIRTMVDDGSLDELALIAHLRNALAASALEELKPDLVIFDEFQRFRDLLNQDLDEASSRVIRKLRGDGQPDPPALLLLSATPYRLFTRRREEEEGSSHRQEFFDLIEFLFGGDQLAKSRRKECEGAFALLEGELRKGAPGSPEGDKAKSQIERLLTQVIARTERASHPDGWDHYQTIGLPSPLEPDDLAVFKHLSASLIGAHKSSAVPYWSSIPFPMQSMGNHYVAWRAAEPAPAAGVPHLSEEIRDRYKRVSKWPHPRLRALQKLANPENLVAPWLAPTAPWWKLRGLWEKEESRPGKLLIFSRFRAVPQAIAATLSYDLESRFLRNDPNCNYLDATKRRLLTAGEKRHSILGIFHPSPFLVESVDPLGAGSSDFGVIRRFARARLKSAIRELEVLIDEKAPAIKPWKLLARLDLKAGNWVFIDRAWRQLHWKNPSAGDPEDSGLGQLLNDWNAEAEKPLEKIRPQDFESLVDYALGSPGIVLARALRRHWEGAVSPEGFLDTLRTCWAGLRTYMDQRWFYRVTCRRSEKFPEALLRLTVDGNLEAVLDEHFWVTSRTRSMEGCSLATELLDSLSLKNGIFHLHAMEGKKQETFSLRCHVAMPFIQTKARAVDGDEKPIRTDEIRKAFNSPFWPYVLATTSVGQEGLDFHLWCESLVHWDLCRNPVDLEQREGRIQRFAGLSTRRQVAGKLCERVIGQNNLSQSPWEMIGEIADSEMKDESGLAPWWVIKNGSVKRYVLEVPSSEQKRWLVWMKKQRLLYRLALGQPNQEDLLEVLAEKLPGDSQAWRKGVVNLSPYFNRNAGGRVD